MTSKEFIDEAMAIWVKLPYYQRALIWFTLGLITGGVFL